MIIGTVIFFSERSYFFYMSIDDLTQGWTLLLAKLIFNYYMFYCFFCRVAHPELPTYGGQVRAENVIKHLDEIGTRIDHVYQVANDGPSTANRLTIVIDWPYQVASGYERGDKWLLYLTEWPVVEGDGECLIAGPVGDSAINPLKLQNLDASRDQPLLYGRANSLAYSSSEESSESSRIDSVSGGSVHMEGGYYTGEGVHLGPSGSIEGIKLLIYNMVYNA
jgi:hypothetical protein